MLPPPLASSVASYRQPLSASIMATAAPQRASVIDIGPDTNGGSPASQFEPPRAP